MNTNHEIERNDQTVQPLESQNIESVDDFIKELEEKEKDLHITADLTIEIEEAINEGTIPHFIKADPEKEAASKTVDLYEAVPPANNQTELAREIVELKQKIFRMESERAEMIKDATRRSKDFENYKTRTERERRESFVKQISNLATQMLPVLDNLDRALDFSNELSHEKSVEFDKYFEGLVLVNQQMNEVLAEMGVQPIVSVGETFDPHLHEAVAAEPHSPDFPPNTVSEELLRGYRIGERVIRHSMVKVTKSVDENGNNNFESRFVEESSQN